MTASQWVRTAVAVLALLAALSLMALDDPEPARMTPATAGPAVIYEGETP